MGAILDVGGLEPEEETQWEGQILNLFDLAQGVSLLSGCCFVSFSILDKDASLYLKLLFTPDFNLYKVVAVSLSSLYVMTIHLVATHLMGSAYPNVTENIHPQVVILRTLMHLVSVRSCDRTYGNKGYKAGFAAYLMSAAQIRTLDIYTFT